MSKESELAKLEAKLAEAEALYPPVTLDAGTTLARTVDDHHVGYLKMRIAELRGQTQ